MKRKIHGWLAAAMLATTLSSAALAQTAPDTNDAGKQYLRLNDGDQVELHGVTYRAHGALQAVAVMSSEFTTVAVIDGALSGGGRDAGPGQVLVTPIEHGATQRFSYDAARLRLTLRPDWLATADAPLQRVAARQRRQRFWGRLEPVNVNVTAPVSPDLEGVRAGYLANDVIAQLRRQSGGDRTRLAPLTAARFASALSAHDIEAVAALIDPKPFTDTGAAAPQWQAARRAFAAGLVADPGLARAMADAPVADPADAGSFVAGNYRMTLVPRDRALFVVALEPLS